MTSLQSLLLPLLLLQCAHRLKSAPTTCIPTTGSTLWGLTRISSHSQPDYSAVPSSSNGGGGGASCSGTPGAVVAYIMANGVYTAHSELEDRATWGFTANFITEGNDDLTGFGTSLAAVVGGKTFGPAKKVSIVSVKVLNKNLTTYMAAIVNGINWICADFNARMKNGTALGGVVLLALSYSTTSTAIDQTLAACQQQTGLVWVAPAGDKGFDTCTLSPCRLSNVLTVAATTIKDTLADFSGYGGCVDLLAPGDQILSATIGSPTATAIGNSSSLAAALVTGAVAQYLNYVTANGQQPSLSDIKTWLTGSATSSAITIPPDKPQTPNLLLYFTCNGLLCPASQPTAS